MSEIGPSFTFKGKGTYKERDDAAYRVVIDASGRDSRGNGTASATVTGTMVADGQDKTAVTMVTDMTITGRPAQFGRGVISDIADKIIGQFAGCVAEKLAPQAAAGAAPAVATAVAAGGGSANGSSIGAATAVATSPDPSATPGVAAPKPVAKPFTPMKSEIDAIDLFDTAGSPVLKRLAPVLGGGALLFLIVLLIRRIRSR